MPNENNNSSEFENDDWNFDNEDDAEQPMLLGKGIAALDFTESLEAKEPSSRNKPAEGRVVESRLFSALTAEDEPLFPLPPDTMTDLYYQTRFETRCVLCRAPEHLRVRAEHIYLEDPRKKPQSVVNFFARFYGARITHECVAEHMKRHCFLDHLYRDGLQDLAKSEESAMIWKYREHDLNLTALITQLGEVRGLDCRTKDDKFKQTQAIIGLTDKIMRLQKQRDDAAAYGINPFEALARLLEKMPTKETKRLVAEEARYLRELISKEQDAA